jgi:hypothetical protein
MRATGVFASTTDIGACIQHPKLPFQDDISRVQLFREICVHARLAHPNIVQFIAAFIVSCHGFLHSLEAPADPFRHACMPRPEVAIRTDRVPILALMAHLRSRFVCGLVLCTRTSSLRALCLCCRRRAAW